MKGCLVAFGFIFLIIVFAVIIGSMLKEDSKKLAPTKTETQVQTETEKASITKTLKAGIRFDGSQFIITNNNSFDWTDVKFKLNEGIIKAGYRLNVDRIKAGHIYTVGAMQFTKPDGTRFNPFTMKPQTMFIFCDEGDWNGEWK